MSMEFMVRAFRTRVGNPLRKLVLIKLADNANDKGECWPSYQHIADLCEISRRSAIAHVRALEDGGFLTIERRRDGEKNLSNVIKLARLGGESPALGVVNLLHQGGESPARGGGESPAPGTYHLSEPTTEPVKGSGKKKSSVVYTDTFEQAWRLYPSRPGASKKASFKAWQARVREGVDPADLIDGVTRYAEYCRRHGTEPQFIKQPATFFGPGEHYAADWAVPSGSDGNGGTNGSGKGSGGFSSGDAAGDNWLKRKKQQ